MAFDEKLAARIPKKLVRKKGVEERMFGSSCFMFNGNLLVGVWKDSLIVRSGEWQGEEAMLETHVKSFDSTDISDGIFTAEIRAEPFEKSRSEQAHSWRQSRLPRCWLPDLYSLVHEKND